MVEYTTFIPKEFFFEGITGLQALIVIIIILAIIVFFGYKIFKMTGTRRREESF